MPSARSRDFALKASIEFNILRNPEKCADADENKNSSNNNDNDNNGAKNAHADDKKSSNADDNAERICWT